MTRAITDESRAVVDVYDLDAPRRLKATFGKNLPANPAAAERLVRQRLADMGDAALGQAYLGLIQALNYKLDRLPAVVFDEGVAVVYGTTDWEKALAVYRQWREGQP